MDKTRPICQADEEEVGRSIPLLNDYSLSKYLMNLQARQSENIYNLRLFGVYGPYEDWKTCFISNLCAKAVHSLPLTVRQECVFDFLLVDDLVQPVRSLLEAPAPRRMTITCAAACRYVSRRLPEWCGRFQANRWRSGSSPPGKTANTPARPTASVRNSACMSPRCAWGWNHCMLFSLPTKMLLTGKP